MTIIELTALDNGAHRNQTVSGKITPPEGWAVIPAGMELPATYPFVFIEADGQTVTKLTPNQEAYDAAMAEIVEPEPQPSTEDRVSALEEENALLKAQVAAQSDQMDFYEDCIAEMAAVVYA